MFRHGAPEKDYYAILQVDPRAEPEVIDAAYRRLSRKYHPDISGDGGARMRELNEAFEVLGNPARRQAYDRRRTLGAPSAAASHPLLFSTLLRPLLAYGAVAILLVMSLRILPLLLRPPILVVAAVAVLVYFSLRGLRRP